MASVSDMSRDLSSLNIRSPSPRSNEEATRLEDQDHSSPQQSVSKPLPASYPPRLSQPYSGFAADEDEGDCDIVQPQDPDHMGSASAATSLSIPDMLASIKRNAISKCRPVKKVHPPMENVCLIGQTTGRIRWIQPSGPRRPGEGTEDDVQGIVDVQETNAGGILLRITLLASGFVIGPAGYTIREIIKQTGADVKSWTDKLEDDLTRPTRTFIIEGHPDSVATALRIICDGIARYKELCEGKYAGHLVSRMQIIHGITFSYQPPPRTIVPHAAGLKGQGGRVRAACGGGSGRLRIPAHGNAATQTAVRILADVKNCLSAQSAMKAAAAQSSGMQQSGCPASPHMHAVQAHAGHAPEYVGTQAPGGMAGRSSPYTSVPYHASTSPQPSVIPPGYAMVAPNVLVPISALISDQTAAQKQQQGKAYTDATPYMQDALMSGQATYSSLEGPSYFGGQGEYIETFAPVTPIMESLGGGFAHLHQQQSPNDISPDSSVQWSREGSLAYATPSRGSTPRSTLEHRSFVNVQDASPTPADAPFKDFYDQLLSEKTLPPVDHQNPAAAGQHPTFPQAYQADATTPTFAYMASTNNAAGGAAMIAAFEACAGQLASPEPPTWQHDTGSPFGMLHTVSSPPAPGWPGFSTPVRETAGASGMQDSHFYPTEKPQFSLS